MKNNLECITEKRCNNCRNFYLTSETVLWEIEAVPNCEIWGVLAEVEICKYYEYEDNQVQRMEEEDYLLFTQDEYY